LFYAEEQADKTKLLVAFRSFTNAPQNCRVQISWEVKNPPSPSRGKFYTSAVYTRYAYWQNSTLQIR